MSIIDLMRTPVQTVENTATITEIAGLMVENSIGALVITAPGGNKPVGIVTDRDLVRIIAKGFDSKTSLEAATPPAVDQPLITATADDDLKAITDKMHKGGVRRVPVVDAAGDLVGIISLDDLLVLLGRDSAALSQMMADVSAAVKTEFLHEHAMTAGFSWFKP